MAFMTIEGIEGCGKSTQARLLAERLGRRAVLTAEPGSTELGKAIRSLLLHQGGRISPSAELLLFLADRAQHVEEVIRPALSAGKIVISDRYMDSTLAYQGYGRGLPLAYVRSLTTQAAGGLIPDVTVVLDIAVEVGLARARERSAPDRMEAEERAFHERVRQGFLALAREEPERFVVIDARGDVEEVAWRVRVVAAAHGIGGKDVAR